jgi:FlaG/FlaF family flagellin (archaellin)
MITIGLAGTAYVYISGMMTGKMAKAISVLDASCTNKNITLVVSNDGQEAIVNSATGSDLKILVNNLDKTSNFYQSGGSSSYTINPRGVVVLLDNATGYATGVSHTVLLVSPSNSITQRIWC